MLILMGDSAAAPFDPASLFEGSIPGEFWLSTDAASLGQVHNGSTGNVVATDDVIGRWNGQLGRHNFTEANAGSKPLFDAANNSVRFFNGKGYSNTGFHQYDGARDWSWFVFSRLSSTSQSADQHLLRMLRASTNTIYGMNPNGYAGNTNRAYRQGGLFDHSIDIASVPAQNAFHGIATAYEIAAVGSAGGYYNDVVSNYAPGATTGDNNASEYIQLGYGNDAAPELEVKVVLGIGKILTAVDRRNLYNFARSLP